METKDLMGDSFKSKCARELCISLLQPASSVPGEGTLERRGKMHHALYWGLLHTSSHIIFVVIQPEKYYRFASTGEDIGKTVHLKPTVGQ